MHFAVTLVAMGVAAYGYSICGGEGSGQVGVGVTQLCGYSPGDTGCDQAAGALFAGNCDVNAGVISEGASGFCQGGWDSGAEVDCDSNGNPTYVHTPHNGNYANCYQSSGDCSGGLGDIAQVYYCCSYVSG